MTTETQLKAINDAVAMIEKSKTEAQALAGISGALWVCCFENDKTPFRSSDVDGRISIAGGKIWARRAGDVRKMAKALDDKAVASGAQARVIAMPLDTWVPARITQLDEIIASIKSNLPQ